MPPDGKEGEAYRYNFIADGFPAPVYFVAGDGLPPDLVLNPDGALTGTPKQAGPFSFQVTAANSAGFCQSRF